MTAPVITKTQARRFLLAKHGLLGRHRFIGKQGTLDFIREVGCIQYDPVNVCGRNADLVLQARVKGYRGEMLYDLLYHDRSLVDAFDKNLSIMPTEDYPYFSRERARHVNHERSLERLQGAREQVLGEITRRGALCAADLGMKEKASWYWSDSSLARVTLEHLYFQGALGIDHKNGTNKYYDLAQRLLPSAVLSAPDPLQGDAEHAAWRVLRRIGSVGMLWNRPSDVFLNIPNLKALQRAQAFDTLLARGDIAPVTVEGMPHTLYVKSADLPALLEAALSPAPRRCEFLAPLDNLLWDRKLIKALFDYDYTWEIYTPKEKRVYGHYVLPLLYGDAFAGRLSLVCDRKAKTLRVERIWYEEKFKTTAAFEKALAKRLTAFCAFSGMERIVFSSSSKENC